MEIEVGDKVQIAENCEFLGIPDNPSNEIGTVIQADKHGWHRVKWETCNNSYRTQDLVLVKKADKNKVKGPTRGQILQDAIIDKIIEEMGKDTIYSSQTCTCEFNSLMRHGCTCGGFANELKLEKEQNEQAKIRL